MHATRQFPLVQISRGESRVALEVDRMQPRKDGMSETAFYDPTVAGGWVAREA